MQRRMHVDLGSFFGKPFRLGRAVGRFRGFRLRMQDFLLRFDDCCERQSHLCGAIDRVGGLLG
jgi:hypothetical protein